VLATHQHTGLRRWFSRSVAELIARRSGEMTSSFRLLRMDLSHSEPGQLRFSRILIPIDIAPYPRLAIEAATALVEALEQPA
jgi:nucleotide-binding universal stress UspA family protein